MTRPTPRPERRRGYGSPRLRSGHRRMRPRGLATKAALSRLHHRWEGDIPWKASGRRNLLSCAKRLRAGRGRPALINGDAPAAESLVEHLRPLPSETISLGQRIGLTLEPPSASRLIDDVGAAPVTLLTEIEVLFTPELRIDAVSQLRRISQRTALIVVWPGRIASGRLSYSLRWTKRSHRRAGP